MFRSILVAAAALTLMTAPAAMAATLQASWSLGVLATPLALALCLPLPRAPVMLWFMA